ncbi:YfiR family protein [Chitinimonas lacunae]|uniref:YfiR family protein n=1 Tax=Chitinimonas lacunae TaxID=1963018 RepID=A0ABV8MSN0_9NEIS
MEHAPFLARMMVILPAPATLPRSPLARCRMALLVWLGAWVLTGQPEAAAPAEYDVKMAYVLNFTRYVQWPAASMAPGAPMRICVIGEDPFGDSLDRAVNASPGRPLAARRLRRVEEAADCHIVLIAKDEEKRQAQWLLALQGKPILTVGESEHFIRDGGVIGLLLVKSTVRFEVNLDAAQRAGLRISSRMLSLAEAVHNSSAEEPR